MNQTILTVGIIVVAKNKVLLITKKNYPKQYLTLPGGQVEEGETLEGAAVRELRETTGLETRAEHLELLPQEWQARITKNYGTRNFLLKCLVCHKYQGRIVETKSSVPEWVLFSRLNNAELAPNTKAAIQAANLLPHQNTV